MVAELFEALLQEIGTAFHVSLKPDSNNSCLFKTPNGISIQMEIDRRQDCYIIGCDLGPIPKGRYREELFREALRTNGAPPPQYGIFAYSKNLDHFILHARLPLKEITGEKIVAVITPFLEKASIWKSAISKGEIPVYTPSKGGIGSKAEGLFGMKP